MSTLVIGIGNPDRGDDALGLRVLEALGDPPPGVRCVAASGDMLRVLDLLDDAQCAILVDAMVSGAEPGTVLRLDASTDAVKTELATFASTHAFNLAETIELARALGRLPERVIVFGVEAADMTPGAGLSAAVAQAVPQVTELIKQELTCTKPR